MSDLRVIGVPSSAGAYCIGVEGAPAALRAAGLIDALRGAGVEVRDDGDLTERRWRPDREHPLAQNAADELDALEELVAALADPLAAGERVLVLGGACTVALGVCAAVDRSGVRARTIYIDRHLDVNTPSTTREGSLSWMGMAHALGVPGSVDALSALGRSTRMLAPADLVYLGVDLHETTEGERRHLAERRIPVIDQRALVNDLPEAARRALATLGPGLFAVHLDVDVLDFLDAPLAENVNGRNSGPTIEQLGAALRVLAADDGFRVLSIGQLDPNHAAADPDALRRFVAMLTTVLAP